MNSKLFVNNEFPQIIGISGKKGHGKDTLGKFFIDNYQYQRFAFADPLKKILEIIFDFTDDQLFGNLKEIPDPYWNCSPRKIQQFVGTDLFRDQLGQIIPNLDKNIWVEVTKRKIQKQMLNNPKSRIIITDVRFCNEAQMIRELNGVIIKVNRDSIKNLDSHVSETENDEIIEDYYVSNNGTINEMYNSLFKL